MANKTLEEANSSRSISLELRIDNNIVDTGDINYGESKLFTIDNNKFEQGSSDLDLYVNNKLADTTQIMRKVSNFSDVDIVKPGIGDNEDLMPHVFKQQDECQNDTLALYLNGYRQEERDYYPEVKALFRLWAEGKRETERYIPYDVDIFTYPNLEYDYTLRKIDPEDGECLAEWHSADRHDNLGITYPESPLPLPNGLDWEPTGHVIGEELEFEYKIYVEVFTSTISEENKDPKTTSTQISLEQKDDFFSAEDSITITMDEDKKIGGYFGVDKNIKANFYGSKLEKVYQPDGIEEINSVAIQDESKTLLDNLMSPDELELEVEDEIVATGDVVIEVTSIISNHSEEDINLIPGQRFDYESYKNSIIEAENEDFDVTGCLEPAIEVIDHSRYNHYSSVDAEIKFENGETIAYEPKQLLGYNNYMFDRNSYDYEDSGRYQDEVRITDTALIELPAINNITGTNRDIIEDITTTIEDSLELEGVEPSSSEEFTTDEESPEGENDSIPLERQYFGTLTGNIEAFITRYDRLIGNVKSFRTDLSYKSLVVFAYELKEGNVDLDWEYGDIRSHKIENHMTLAHNINFIESLPINDILNISPDLAKIDEGDGRTEYEEFNTKRVYLKTDMFYSSINGVDYDNRKRNFNIPYEILPVEDDDSLLPVILGEQEYRISIALPSDTDHSTLKVCGEVVRAQARNSGFVVTNNTWFKADNSFDDIDSKYLWDNSVFTSEETEITEEPETEKTYEIYFVESEDLTQGNLIIESDYAVTESYDTFWQSDVPVVIKLTDICPGDIRITPDNALNLFTSQNIDRYWNIPKDVHGPYTISIDSSNPLVANRANYFTMPHEIKEEQL